MYVGGKGNVRLFRKKAVCPYCGNELEKKPTRKKKCPHCSEYFYVRQGELYTEQQAKDLTFKRKWLNILERFGGTEKMFVQKRKELSKRFDFEASVNDTIWGMMMELPSKQEDPIDTERLYIWMGQFVEEEDKDPAPYIKQAMTMMEKRIRLEVRGLSKLSVATCNDDLVCESCKEASERVLTRDEFLEKMPIASGCLNPSGCRCWVNAEVDL